MTNKIIQIEIKKLEQTISDAKDEIKSWHHELRINSPIQIGDRVKITTPEHTNPWGNRGIVPESRKEAQCIELEIDTWGHEHTVKPVFHPITKAGVVAKVGRFTASSNDIIKKL